MQITSLQNDRVKLVKALQTQAKARKREDLVVLEGVRLLSDALRCGAMPEFVFYLGDNMTLSKQAFKMFRDLDERGVQLYEVTDSIMDAVSDVETSSGVLAVLPKPDLPIPDSPSLVVVPDRMSTPGNLGTVLRTAAAAGADLVVLPPNTVDPFNPKVLRGGMGAHFRLPIVQMDWTDIALTYGKLSTYVAAASGDQQYYQVDWLRPSMVIIGGEAHGASKEAFAVAGSTLSIPMAGDTESLNAAVAAGVILFEIRRQRLLSAEGGAR